MSIPNAPANPAPHRDKSSLPWLIAAALAVAWCVYLAAFGPKGPQGSLPQPLLQPPRGSQAQYRWLLEDLDGKRVDFAGFRGKPVFLNIWATWCPPCVAEMPSINNLATNARLKDLPIVCVAVSDERSAVRRFAQQYKLATRVLIAVDSPPPAFQTQGIPATFVLDGSGNILVQEVGAAQWDTPRVVDFLERLLREQR